MRGDVGQDGCPPCYPYCLPCRRASCPPHPCCWRRRGCCPPTPPPPSCCSCFPPHCTHSSSHSLLNNRGGSLVKRTGHQCGKSVSHGPTSDQLMTQNHNYQKVKKTLCSVFNPGGGCSTLCGQLLTEHEGTPGGICCCSQLNTQNWNCPKPPANSYRQP